MKVAIIGAGAAGCFCAVNIKRRRQEIEVDVYEAMRRPLAKVAVTGGGRCNLTNTFAEIGDLGEAYPRGAKLMKRVFHTLDNEGTMEWFRKSGVRLTTQADECVFPASQDAMEIVSTLTRQMAAAGVRLHTGKRVRALEHDGMRGRGYVMSFSDEETATADVVVVTTGGSPTPRGVEFLSGLGLKMEPPVPSLFALELDSPGLHELSGIVVEDAVVGIAGTKLKATGALLLTHFGASGPAVLKLSSYAARELAEKSYHATLCVNWMGTEREEKVRAELETLAQQNRQKTVANVHPRRFTQRLWEYLIERAGTSGSMRCSELTKKHYNKMTAILTSDTYTIGGQNRHKEEFVTCGGVSLSNIDMNTLEAKQHSGLYFAGEALDVDAITGGFNLQAAWSMGYVVACSICG